MEAPSIPVVVLTWLGIAFCVSQSALFSGLNLAFFSVSRLRLEIEQANGNQAAARVLALRRDSNFLLTTVLWGNVAINVLLTLLSNSVMVGLSAFLFSTFAITICGEIMPQAYFSRNALRMASMLSPLLRVYQVVLYVIAKPTALVLDAWLGEESIQYMRERDVRQLIHQHIRSTDSDLDAVEGVGALNFLAIDDVHVSQEGEPVAPESVLPLEMLASLPPLPGTQNEDQRDSLVGRVAAIHQRWVILVDDQGFPVWALDSAGLLRTYARGDRPLDWLAWCHHPIVVKDPHTRFGSVIALLKAGQPAQSDAPIPPRVILLWSDEKRIITKSDILGRLFKGIGLFSEFNAQRPHPQ